MLAVADSSNHVVRLLSVESGAELQLGGGAGKEQGALHFPFSVAATAAALLVAEAGTRRVQAFVADAHGALVGAGSTEEAEPRGPSRL